MIKVSERIRTGIVAFVCLALGIFFIGSVYASVLAHTDTSNELEDLNLITNISESNFDEKINELEEVDNTNLEYSDSLSQITNLETYTDTAGNTYLYDDVGELVGYQVNQDIMDEEQEYVMLSRGEVLDCAYTFLNGLVDSGFQYTLQDVSYDEDLGTYEIAFGYQIGGYKTTDIVYLEIDNSGNLISYIVPRESIFSEIIIEQLNTKVADKYVIHCLQEELGNNLINYTINEYILTYYNDEIQFNVIVEYTYWSGDQEIREENIFLSPAY